MTSAGLVIVLSALLAAAPARPEPAPAAGPHLRRAWDVALGAARGSALKDCQPLGERLLVMDRSGGVTALDPRTGALQWFVQAPGPLRFRPSDGGAVALASGQTVIAVDGRTGRRLLEVTSASAPGASPCSDGQRLYVPARLDDTLVAWDLASGQRSWEFRMPAPFAGASLMCGSEGSRSVLVSTDDGLLRAIPAQADVPAGERWRQRVGRLVDAPALGAGRVYVSSADRVLTALDQASGTVVWKQFTGDPPLGPPVLVGSHVAVQTAGSLLVFASETGALAWDLPGGGAPVGEVGGELLLQQRDGSTSEWREIATGRLLADRLPRAAATCGSRLIELEGDTDVVGWERGIR